MGINVDFESIKGMAANVATTAKKKASTLAAIAKANVAIYAEEDKVKKAEAELGRLYYNDVVAGNGADTEAYLPICDRITESKNTIQEPKAQVAKLKTQSASERESAVYDVTDADFVVSGEDDVEPVREDTAPEAAGAESFAVKQNGEIKEATKEE